ncbi:MAG: hypothetical protein JWO53_979 [Chlamydiia bacterium]|nr:hypothetical protein [Chlamydiia bacterium]
MRSMPALPIPVKKGLRKIGQDIRNARLRRRIPMELMAERASISRTTLTKVEKGDPSVAFGIYASIIFVLGLVSQLACLFDADNDHVGRSLEEEKLPKRIRLPKKAPFKGG